MHLKHEDIHTPVKRCTILLYRTHLSVVCTIAACVDRFHLDAVSPADSHWQHEKNIVSR